MRSIKTMKIRNIKKEDKEQIYLLAKEEDEILQKFASFPVYEVNFNKKMFEKLFNSYFEKNHLFIGIEIEKNIIAIISGYIKNAPNGNVGYIDNMFVSNEYRGQGYSTILRDEFLKWLKKKKIEYCQLDVLAKNHHAVEIYQKWNFKIDGLQMTKKI
jgi:ribosomal protein S18 acetylase RimI-like enzyme